MPGRAALFLALTACVVYFLCVWLRGLKAKVNHGDKESENLARASFLWQLGTGFLTNFLDTLGIGSFATTTTIFKVGRMVPDELIPGTMNVGHTLPTILEAFLYITIIDVDLKTLLLLISSSVAGAWCGASVVARLPRRAIQFGMAGALAASILFLVMAQLHWFPAGGKKLSLTGVALVVGMLGSCCFGALGTLGIGFYAPCMILVSLLGMAPLAAFPIMMGSSAFLMPVASARFLRRQFYHPRAAAGLALGGLPGVLLAAIVVKSLPLRALRWLVIAVALWASLLLFRAGLRAAEKSNSPQDKTSHL